MRVPNHAHPDLSYWEFRTLLELMMCSDPWPAGDDMRIFLKKLLNREAQEREYSDWVEAYHAI